MVDSVTGDGPIHSIVKMKKKHHTDYLYTLLINSNAQVDLENRKKKTALLIALEVNNVCLTFLRIKCKFQLQDRTKKAQTVTNVVVYET